MARRKRTRTLFADREPRSRMLADVITIRSPTAFRESIRLLKKDGLSIRERSALVFAQNRAVAQLGRKNLSVAERVQFEKIRMIRIPRAKK